MEFDFYIPMLEITAFALMVVKWCSCRTRIETPSSRNSSRVFIKERLYGLYHRKLMCKYTDRLDWNIKVSREGNVEMEIEWQKPV
jgi:hypothetical protein